VNGGINGLKTGFKGSFMEKRRQASFLFVWQWIVPMLGLWLGSSVWGAPTLSVSPATMADNNLGTITLQIGGLQSGETVHVGKFADLNGNGVVDPGDLMIQAFQLIDGQITVVGGVTNVNIPFDADATPGSIKAQLNLQTSGVEQKFVGKYIFMLISPTGRFAPITAPFQISNAVRGQSISGNVQSGGSPVPNAMVIVFTGSGDNMNPQGGVIADNAGHFSIQAAPGNYMVSAFRSNYVADMSSGPSVNLVAGGSSTANVTLVPATCSISGRVTAAFSEDGLPGVMVPAESQTGGIAIGFTDTDGAFKVPVTSGLWKVHPESANLNLMGFVSLSSSVKTDTTTGSVSGLAIAVPWAGSLFYGHVRDALNQPISGLALYGEDGSGNYESSAVTDENGRYVMGVSSGSWRVSVDNNNAAYANYIFTQMPGYSQVDSGQAIQQHFTGSVANFHIAGTVKNNGSAGVSGVGVYAYATINNASFNAYATTDDSGHYSLPVAPGTWQVGLSCDGNDGLGTRGYACVAEKTVVISNADGSANFIVSSCPNLAVRTSSLPDGQNGSSYYAQLEADGCQTPFHWSLAPGSASLPPGLYLNDDGTMGGQCQNYGYFTFTVRVTDATQNTADRQLSIQVAGSSLQITTYQLPYGTIGTNYSAQMTASGGQPPYVWSIPPASASLPPNVTLSSSGLISGMPTNSGTTYFYIRVTDATSNYVEEFFSMTVNYPALAIETTTLPNATVGLPYTGQLVGTGGLVPYFWSLGLGSANLPDGLALGTNGVVFGTPTASGNFGFIANLSDANYANVSRAVSLQIQAAPVRPALSAPGKLGASQFQFTVTGTAGQTYSIDTTSDFKQWTTVLVTNAPANSFPIQMDRSTNRATFYRVKVGQ
jgi:hypothetical protein